MIRETIKEAKSKLIILSGSQSKIDTVMDKIQQWNEKNGYPFQELSSYTKDYKHYVIEVDDVNGYQKYKKTIEKFL